MWDFIVYCQAVTSTRALPSEIKTKSVKWSKNGNKLNLFFVAIHPIWLKDLVVQHWKTWIILTEGHTQRLKAGLDPVCTISNAHWLHSVQPGVGTWKREQDLLCDTQYREVPSAGVTFNDQTWWSVTKNTALLSLTFHKTLSTALLWGTDENVQAASILATSICFHHIMHHKSKNAAIASDPRRPGTPFPYDGIII